MNPVDQIAYQFTWERGFDRDTSLFLFNSLNISILYIKYAYIPFSYCILYKNILFFVYSGILILWFQDVSIAAAAITAYIFQFDNRTRIVRFQWLVFFSHYCDRTAISFFSYREQTCIWGGWSHQRRKYRNIETVIFFFFCCCLLLYCCWSFAN